MTGTGQTRLAFVEAKRCLQIIGWHDINRCLTKSVNNRWEPDADEYVPNWPPEPLRNWRSWLPPVASEVHSQASVSPRLRS